MKLALLAPLACALAALAIFGSARAEITQPLDGALVGGDVTIVENRGATFYCSYLPSYTQIEILRGAEVVKSWQLWYGPRTVTWNSTEVPDGAYTIRSLAVEPTLAWPCMTPMRTREIDRAQVTVWNGPRPSIVEISAPPQEYWLETVDVLVTLRDAVTNAPAANETVTVRVGSAESSAVTGRGGMATVPLHLTELPGERTLRATFAGSSKLLPSQSFHSFAILPRPTHVAYEGDVEGVRGATATFAARVTDATPGSALEGSPVAGARVRFDVAPLVAGADSDAEGRAALNAPALGVYGANAWRAVFEPSPGRAPAETSFEFDVLWEFTLDDDAGAGAVRLNTLTQELQLVLPDRELSVRSFAGSGAAWAEEAIDASPPLDAATGRRLAIAYADDALRFAGAFDLSAGRFAAVAWADGIAHVLRAEGDPAGIPPVAIPMPPAFAPRVAVPATPGSRVA